MPEQTTDPADTTAEAAEQPAGEPTAPPAGEQEPEAGDAGSEPQKAAQEPMSIEDALAEIKRLRNENAARRVSEKELRERLDSAKTPEEVEAAVAEVRKKNEELELQLLRERVARQAQLPEALADRLRGNTEEELRADAAQLAGFAQPVRQEPRDVQGGLDPRNKAEAIDPVALAREARERRKQR